MPRGDRGTLFVISGPSGAGKGTIVGAALERRPDIFLSVSATTRPLRRGERDGVNYHFISAREFISGRDRGDFLESAEVYGYLYGTPRAPVQRALQAGRDVICELDIQGALAVKQKKPEAVLIFIEPSSLDQLSARLRGRGTEDPDTMRTRVRAAYEEVKSSGLYDHIVINDRLEDAVAELLRILEQGRS
jgi:guanylate kinase